MEQMNSNFRSIRMNGVPQIKNRSLKLLFNFSIWVIFTLVFHYVSGVPEESDNYYRLVKTIVILASVFYLNYYVFIPQFLSKRKFKQYALTIFGTLIVIFVINYLTEIFFEPPYHRLPPEFMNGPGHPEFLPERHFFINFGILVLSTISFAVSTSIRGTSEWFKNENQLKEIENQKLMAELSYLKAQINPHFFFNTLNGIYALARQKSDKTPDVILKLSVIMRYIIYEANAPKVLLTKELKHIDNYIELQKLRLTETVKVRYEVHGNPMNIMIEPLLFCVFVENAFKHGIDYSKNNTISVVLDILENELRLTVSNPLVPRKTIHDRSDSGIGLENIRKRLELLYPGKHELKIAEMEQNYIVELTLKMKS